MMPIVLYSSKGCKHCDDARWALEKAQKELGFELIEEDVDNPKLKIKDGPNPLTDMDFTPVVCNAEKEGDELIIKSCMPGVPTFNELRGLVSRDKKERV